MPDRPTPDEHDTPAEAPADRTARLAALRRLDGICRSFCAEVDAAPDGTTPGVGAPPSTE